MSAAGTKCDKCDGKGEIDCPDCHGEGLFACTRGCHEVTCERCHEVGSVSCPKCDGLGTPEPRASWAREVAAGGES